MGMKIKPALVIAIIAMAVAACVSDGERADFRQLPDDGWCYGDTVGFANFIAVDSTVAPQSAGRGALTFALRHTNDYPYSNLWVEISYRDDNGVEQRDTVRLELCDVYGRWYGKGIGDYYQMASEVATKGLIPAGATVSVRHIMRVDTLKGIQSVGLLYKPAQGH